MVTAILKILAAEVERSACLKIELAELKNGQKFDLEKKDELYCEFVTAEFEKIVKDLIEANHSFQDVYLALQIAEAESEENKFFAGLSFNHDPTQDEARNYYFLETKRSETFAAKFRPALERIFLNYGFQSTVN